ncbi:MAG: MMPL family transporter [Candidatus Omnitrophica bacterium]|nr:MMPL family transporter [Candidatus Omnitrophota bacterium]
MFRKLIRFSVHHPRLIMAVTVLSVAVSVAQFPRLKVDTDPENMLPEKEFVRVFHHEVKKEFGLYDFIVLGIVNENNPQGVFNVQTLNTIYAITEQVKNIPGVISRELIAPSIKDNIRQGELGSVIFERLMPGPITTAEEALRIRAEAQDNPMFNGTLVSEDGKALCLYLPIEQKNMSYRISQEVFAIVKQFFGEEKYHITGLPVAEDTFGVEMFKQMAVSAPLAGLIIFLLMWWFFRSLTLIMSPMLVAIATVLITMGLLIGFGFPVHIMSSMIPIFLMPIAVLDCVHILSSFFEQYRRLGKRDPAVFAVMDELFTAMLYTSLTSAVGFFSLSFSDIPPVQAFGVFVAIGVMVAWLLTMTFIPAYIALLNEEKLRKIHAPAGEGGEASDLLGRALAGLRRFILARSRLIVVLSVVVVIVSGYGISRITVNDNPVRWFTAGHRIRIADEVLNHHFGGTYTAYLILEAHDKSAEIFKEPEMLRYIERLQRYLAEQGDVGKSTSLVDVVKKVYMELLGGQPENYRIPDTKAAVSQCLISYENSHKPDDLWHMTTPDAAKLNLWIQLKSGDNRDMDRVVRQVESFLGSQAAPFALEHHWAGLTYINLVWQNKMVVGMLVNFFGSFIIVFFMMAFLFRSAALGLISMIPLTITIVFIYSLLGFFGKDYDMPVAVLSALTLGLSIDYAIHFIQRSRELYAVNRSWEQTSTQMFQGPARAIIKNALIIAIGFLPLLAAPLVPYRTVGFFMFTIMFVSSFSTMFILPAITNLAQKTVLAQPESKMFCQCGNCFIVSAAVAVTVIYILRGYSLAGWGPSLSISVAIVAVMGGVCSRVSASAACRLEKKEGKNV